MDSERSCKRSRVLGVSASFCALFLSACFGIASVSSEREEPQGRSTPDASTPEQDAGFEASLKDVDVLTDGDAAREAQAPDVEIPLTSFPQAKTKGGSIITHPKVMAISLHGYEYQTEVDDFMQKLGTSSYLEQLGAEYGISKPVILPPVHVSESLPSQMTGDELENWMRNTLFSGSNPLAGTPDPEVGYMIYLPSSTLINLNEELSCQSFGGYHYEMDVNGVKIGYGVMPTCELQGQEITTLQYLTIASSHEIFEWVSDPFPLSSPAWAAMNDESFAWTIAFEGLVELGDLCVPQFSNGAGIIPSDLGYMVQRQWSNKASLAGKNPCTPSPAGDLFYHAKPMRLPDELTFDLGPEGIVTTRGILLRSGEEKTIEVLGYAESGVAEPWSVSVMEFSNFVSFLSGSSSELSFSQSTPTLSPGQTMHLTVKALGSITPGNGFVIFTQSPDGMEERWWPVLVASP